MLHEGLEAEALRTVTDIRARHDGQRRNPFSEPECGHHYARSMASWGVLLAWTGQRWDAPTGTLHLGTRRGTWPWAAAGAWGTFTRESGRCTITCMHGALPLRSIACDGAHSRRHRCRREAQSSCSYLNATSDSGIDGDL